MLAVVANSFDLSVDGGVDVAHMAAERALVTLGYEVEWSNPYRAVAQAATDPRSIYLDINIQLIDSSKIETIVRIHQKPTGKLKLGANKPDPRMGALKEDLTGLAGLQLCTPERTKHLLEYGSRPTFDWAFIKDGSGWAPAIGSEIVIQIAENELILQPESYEGETIALPFTKISSLSITAHNKQSGGRFFGGGFGLVGAAEGMVVASVLNRLTKSVDKWVVLTLAGPDGSAEIHLADADEQALRLAFRPVRDAIVTPESTPLPVGSTAEQDIVSKIERLATLREAGHLSDDEFAAAKAKLLE
jgi:hypothetical protein